MQRQDHSKLAIIGNVDSGKSTLVGVLTKGILDDGRGGAREVPKKFKFSVSLIINMRRKMEGLHLSLKKLWDLMRILNKYYLRDTIKIKTNTGVKLLRRVKRLSHS